MRLLLIEDEQTLALAIKWALEDLGLEVGLVDSGRQAIGMIGVFKPDLVVVDVTLADINDAVLARHIRDVWPELPVIIVSGYLGDSEDVLELLKEPATAFLQKPFEMDAIVDLAKKLTRRPQDGSS